MQQKNQTQTETQVSQAPVETAEMDRVLGTLNQVFLNMQQQQTQRLQIPETIPPTVFEGAAKNAVDVYNDILAGLRFKFPPVQLVLEAKANKPTEVELSWKDDTNNADGFKVGRSDGNNTADFVEIAQLPFNARTYVDPKVSNNKSYTYRLAAFNVRGETLSTSVSVTTPA
jgi:hypothetical protein